MLRYLTAGESHGPMLSVIIDGMPANVDITAADIDAELQRRQRGYGRGGRMKIESDSVHIDGGILHGKTTGAPIALHIYNKDWSHWQDYMDPQAPPPDDKKTVTHPRPGHADLAGAIKYNLQDIRPVLERSSARETAARVAAGAVARQLLKPLGIGICSHVTRIGSVALSEQTHSIDKIAELADASLVRCIDPAVSKAMMAEIDSCRQQGDSLGGVFEVIIYNVPVGLGSHAQWDRRLDGLLAQAFMSIQAIKGIEIGLGFQAAAMPGSAVHDEIYYSPEHGFYRQTNNAGGIEGGISNGQPIVIRAAMKPIPTLYKPLNSVDIKTKEAFSASIERSDTCAVPAASIVGEAAAAWIMACAVVEKFGGDSLEELKRNYMGYIKQVSEM